MKELQVTHVFDLKSNMVEVRASIEETIAKYDVIVTEDRIGEAKELMATFNKDKKDFATACKKFIDAISEPITEFKAEQKAIEKMYDDGRAKIATQVEKFEAGKLAEITKLVFAYRNEKCAEASIEPSSVTVTDLVMLSAVSTNKSGYALTKKVTDAIIARVQAVENEALKARIKAEEQAAHDRAIAEQARIETEQRMRNREAELIANAEREKAEAVATAVAEAVTQQQAQPAPQEKAPTQPVAEQQERNDGKRVFVITATFEVLAPSTTPHKMISDKLTKIIEAAGINTLKNIEVQ